MSAGESSRQGAGTQRRQPSRLAAAALLAAVLSLAFGCASATAVRQDVGFRARLSDLPPGYSIVIGRLHATLDGSPMRCGSSESGAACGIVLTFDKKQTFLVPHQSPFELLATAGVAQDPFFVVRLPRGEYEVSRFESSPGSLPPASHKGKGLVIPVQKRFRVGDHEAVYVGSLFIDVPGKAGEAATIRLLDESERAVGLLPDVGALPGTPLTVRLMAP